VQKEELLNCFEEIYGGGGEIRVFFAPGRANLIGDHIDRCGGHVFPIALTLGVCCAVRKRTDRTVQMASLNKEAGRVRGFLLDNPYKADPEDWRDCPRAVLEVFSERDFVLPCGMDILYSGDIPIGDGLASSAAMEYATALMVKSLFSFHDLSKRDLISLCLRAAVLRTGMDWGILDYCAPALGSSGLAILLTTKKQQIEYVPLQLGEAKLIITCSGVRGEGIYPVLVSRLEECEKALKKLKVVTNINQLCDLSVDTFNNCKDVIMNDTYMKRARHVVTENARTIRSVSALRVGNIRRFGEQMYLSHASLRDDYEASCPELDFIVDTAKGIPGVLGSRMMGVGFGGSAISLVESGAEEQFRSALSEAYESRFGYALRFYTAEAGDGAMEL
jgi:galactokinase